MADNVQITKGGLEFYEDDGVNRVMIKRQETLASDVYLDLPTSDGTIATQEYVAANAGGDAGVTFVAQTADQTTNNNTPVDTDLTFAVEANKYYWVEGAIMWFDDVASGNGAIQWSLPSGASFSFIRFGKTATSVSTNDWVFGLETPSTSGNVFTTIYGYVKTDATAGTATIQFANQLNDGTVQGIRRGSYLRIIDPQG